ncbi:MAG: hypothetical protein HYZ58_04450 [Acidobacteria bacterium]|nr:hypothetical protein [Acidobacteriota bacterium]
MPPKRIKPEQRLDFRLTLQERDLIIERTFIDAEKEARLRTATPLATPAIWRVPILTSVFVRCLEFSGFASPMTLEMSLAAKPLGGHGHLATLRPPGLRGVYPWPLRWLSESIGDC